jgi:hypothetical protein
MADAFISYSRKDKDFVRRLESSGCHGKRTKTNAKPMQNRFSLTPESARRPLALSPTTFDQRR